MPNSVTVEGVREVVTTLEHLGVEVSDLKDAFTRIGASAVSKVKAATPVRSGRLQATVKGSRRKNSVYIYAGTNKVYYAPYVHWGTKTITGNPWMYRVGAVEGPKAIKELEREMNRIITKLGLV